MLLFFSILIAAVILVTMVLLPMLVWWALQGQGEDLEARQPPPAVRFFSTADGSVRRAFQAWRRTKPALLTFHTKG